MKTTFVKSRRNLAVRNPNLFWEKKIYEIDHIREISFEAPGRLPHSMRIITKEFKNKLYPAGTLRKRTWLELKSKLEQKGVIVNNYCI